MRFVHILALLLLSIGLVKTDDDSKSSDSNENEIDSDVETNQALAAQYLKDIMPTLEAHLQWALDLHFRDMKRASLIDQIDVKYQTKEIGDYLRQITDEFKKYKYWEFTDEYLRRQIEVIVTKDYFILRTQSRERMEDIIEASRALESELNICSYKNPESCEINRSLAISKMLKSEDPEEIEYYWREWRDKAGKETMSNFKTYCEFYNKAANLHGYKRASDMYLYEYEDEYVFDNLTTAVDELRPFFEQLHARIRHILRKKYGPNIIPENTPIPEHIFEKFILEVHEEYPDIVYPFPDSHLTDLGELMRTQNYTPTKFFEEADEFFTSMKIPSALTDDWQDYTTMKEDEDCYPRAVSLFTKVGIGFFYCKEISFSNFLAVHSEMFKVQRDLQTKQLPLPYRVSQTDGFYNGLSDAVQLSVSSPAYLHKIGLIENAVPDPERHINFLYLMAIRLLFEFHREYATMKYYLDALDRKPSHLSNCEFWENMERHVGVMPPIERNDNDFDFIAMISDDFETDLHKHVFARIISYKFYEGLCKKSGKYVEGSSDNELNNCDFSGSEEAGNAIRDLVKLGCSKKWRDLMPIITGDSSFDASSLLKYYDPLIKWLEENNKKDNVYVGWEVSNIVRSDENGTKCIVCGSTECDLCSEESAEDEESTENSTASDESSEDSEKENSMQSQAYGKKTPAAIDNGSNTESVRILLPLIIFCLIPNLFKYQ